ncbi:MAG: hypothetical protein H9847_09510 [Candidatus Anaerobiospirillum pullicola]|uniref:Uncharacterized protein n=1 Tax=Candidatus Anaerobiospirillum pullicola TaxID=2838451 RepID=A0A948THM7_9GAMM|nr:hypothetical protein [Candidatus Anaerobiospirillum pullicola]
MSNKNSTSPKTKDQAAEVLPAERLAAAAAATFGGQADQENDSAVDVESMSPADRLAAAAAALFGNQDTEPEESAEASEPSAADRLAAAAAATFGESAPTTGVKTIKAAKTAAPAPEAETAPQAEPSLADRLAAAAAATFGGDAAPATPAAEQTAPAAEPSLADRLAAAAAATFGDSAPTTGVKTIKAAKTAAPAPEAEPAPQAEPSLADRLAAAAAATFGGDTAPAAPAAEQTAPAAEPSLADRLAAAAAATFGDSAPTTGVKTIKAAKTAAPAPEAEPALQAEPSLADRLAAAAAATFADHAAPEAVPAPEAAPATPSDNLAAAAAAMFGDGAQAEAAPAPEPEQPQPPKFDSSMGLPSAHLPPELQELQPLLAKHILEAYFGLLNNAEREQLLDVAYHGSMYVRPLQELVTRVFERDFGVIPVQSAEAPQGETPEAPVENTEMPPTDGAMEDQEGQDNFAGEAQSAEAAAEIPPAFVPEEPTPEITQALDALLADGNDLNISMDDPSASCAQIALLSLREFGPVMSLQERVNFLVTVLFDTDDAWNFQNLVSQVRLRAIMAEQPQPEEPEPEVPEQVEEEDNAPKPRVFTTRLKPEERPVTEPPKPEVEEKPKPRVVRRRKVVEVGNITRTVRSANGTMVTTVEEVKTKKSAQASTFSAAATGKGRKLKLHADARTKQPSATSRRKAPQSQLDIKEAAYSALFSGMQDDE